MLKRIHITFLFSLFLIISAYGQAPTVAASSITFSNVYCNQMEVSWTNGNGAGRIVIASLSPISNNDLPSDNSFYIASDSFGNGNLVGTDGDAYTVYNGLGANDQVIVKKLDHETRYYFAVVEFNGTGSNLTYLTTSIPKDDEITEYIRPAFSMTDSSHCFEGHTSVYQNETDSSVSGITYTWDYYNVGLKKSDGSDNSYNVTRTYAESQLYRVTLTATSAGCEASTFLYDSVFHHPTASINIRLSSGNIDSVQCFDGANKYRVEAISSVDQIGSRPGLTKYEWDFGNGDPLQTDKIRDVIYTQPGTYQVRMVATTFFNPREVPGCTDTVYQTLIVVAPPIDSTLIDIPDSIQCIDGNLFTFDNNNMNMQSQLWDFGDGTKSANATNTHSYVGTGQYYISLEATDTFGCIDTFYDSVYVIPRPDASYFGLLPTYCQGDPPTKLSAFTGGGNFYANGVELTDSMFHPTLLGSQEVIHVVLVGSCGDRDTMTTVVNAAPVYNLGRDTTLCDTDSILLNIGPAGTYLWNTNSTNQTEWIKSEGWAWGRVTANGCSFTDSLYITHITAPTFDFGPDTSLCGDKVVDLMMHGDDATFNWSTGHPGPMITVDETGIYEGTATNKCGSHTDEISITIAEFACVIFIPNAFSPNNDNINNVFQPTGKFEFVSLEIYTRWGEKLHESFTSPIWDGIYNNKVVDEGTYVFKYVLKVEEEGETLIKPYAGTVNVFW